MPIQSIIAYKNGRYSGLGMAALGLAAAMGMAHCTEQKDNNDKKALHGILNSTPKEDFITPRMADIPGYGQKAIILSFKYNGRVHTVSIPVSAFDPAKNPNRDKNFGLVVGHQYNQDSLQP